MNRRLWLLLAIGTLIRILYTFSFEPFLHWDEAPQAYMAQQIATAGLRPLVHFQLPYIGAVEQYPLAFLMVMLGDEVLTVKVFYLSLSLLSLGIASVLFRHLLPEGWRHLALAFFALCPPVLVHFSLQGWSFASLLWFEVLILCLLFSSRANWNSKAFLFLSGLLSGLAICNNVLFVGLMGFVGWYVYRSVDPKPRWYFAGGLVAGYLPMLVFNLTNGFLSYQFLAAKLFGISQKMVAAHGPFRALLQGVANKVSGKGPPSDFSIFLSFPPFAAPWERGLQAAALVVLAGAVGLALLSLLPRFRDDLELRLLPLSPRAIQVFFASVLFLCVISVSTVRYMIVLVPLVPILLCQGLAVCRRYTPRLMVASVWVLFAYLGVGHVKVLAAENPDPCQGVFQVLEKHHLVAGYGSYQFQSYAAFLSKGRIKISPQIGPMYIDKIPSFSQAVDQAEEVFFILPEGFSLDYLEKHHIRYETEQVDGWVVIWNLSQRVYPKELLSPEELARDDGYMRWSYRENPLVLNPYRGGH